MIRFEPVNNYTWQHVEDATGLIPSFLDVRNPATAREQLDQAYNFAGGWDPFKGFTFDKEKLILKYPGDPPMRAVARAKLRDETILVFPSAWVVIVQPNGDWEVARMD